MKINATAFLLVFSFLLFASCEEARQTRVLKLAHGLDVTHPVHKGMVYMKQQLEQVSGGKMTLEIYPSQQLGSEREALELLQIGSLDMTKVSAGVMESFSPKFRVLGLPYLFRDRAHQFAVQDGPIGEEILRDGENYWLRGLCFYDAGSRSFYMKDRPINTPADLQGLKIRVMESPTAQAMVSIMGGSPTPMSYGELYTSLQQGVVDGAENNPPSFYSSRHYEVCKYYSLDEHTALPDVLLIGTKVWNKLSPEEQEWLQAAVDASVPEERRLWAESEEESLREVQKAGVEIIYPDKKPFEEKVQPLYDALKNDPTLYDLVQRIRAVETDNPGSPQL
ncbi:tripartite ATP-independent transporter solute receptor, DctP family [Catalinimonas alkaloidigena]|uniref:Tripartite ATP-independent transporter solute receptor, DctP family n=1 Tax=Catalinimonas alkaloidigena TaxID=1075417 RepID=A0A1G9H7H6_9BACT|nr:TRAP transporter substrate-binding protein [Catalinimonas alkaloidigena]SDL08968.1 tripartite ATP-independent transporter solute receptor, DctP family [Catalinimonas alkaloidigena]